MVDTGLPLATAANNKSPRLAAKRINISSIVTTHQTNKTKKKKKKWCIEKLAKKEVYYRYFLVDLKYFIYFSILNIRIGSRNPGKKKSTCKTTTSRLTVVMTDLGLILS